jgi:hypothetical protein
MKHMPYLIFDSPFSPQGPSRVAHNSLVRKLFFVSSASYRQLNFIIMICFQVFKFEKVLQRALETAFFLE